MFYGGEVLGDSYEIIREIGNGGTGVIYLAWHMRLRKEVVVKKIHDNFVGKINVRSEVDILKGLHHSGLPQVYDFLQIDRQIYTVMEYIQGYDLQYYLDNGYYFEERQLMLWLRQLCEVLDYLHTRKPRILHSDIKPGNIMITQEGNICLIDFNISLDGDNNGELKGLSRYFAAPEQRYKAQLIQAGMDASGIQLDQRMDIYSLGATFFQLMTGMVPETDREKQFPIQYLEVPYSEGLKSIIGKAMEWEPEKRFSSANAMSRGLEKMYRLDRSYKTAFRLGMVGIGFSAVLLVLGVLSTAYGWKWMNRESYEQAYSSFLLACEAYDCDATINRGLMILNNERQNHYLSENMDKKAELYNQIGEAYFQQEQYAQAAEYYRYAQSIQPQEGEYYCNRAIAEARSGNLESAERVLNSAERKGLTTDSICLAQQEIAYCKENYDLVIEIGQQLISSPSKQIAARSCMLSAKAYQATGNIEEQTRVLEQAYKKQGGIRCLRELGKCCLELAQKGGRQSVQLLEKSEECYRQLYKSSYGIESDGLNLAVALEMQEDYEESLSLLQELEQKGSELYQVYMHMSLIYIQYNGKLAQAEAYYKKADAYYRKEQKEDETMELLKELLTEYAKGEKNE